MVRVDRESSCGGNCVSCKGCPSSAVVVECVSEEALKKGDTVKIVMPKKRFFKNVFWGYGQLVVLSVFGALFGYVIFKTEISSVIGLIAGIACGLVISGLVFRNNKCELKAVLVKSKG